MDREMTKSEGLNQEPEESGLFEEMNVSPTELVTSESVEAVNSEVADPENMELAEPVQLEHLDQVDAETADSTAVESVKEPSIGSSSEPTNAEPLKSVQNELEADVIKLEENKASLKQKAVIRKKKLVAKGSAVAAKPKGKVLVKKKVSKPNAPVALIDLTDEIPKESLQTVMEGKEREDEDEKQSQHQVLVQPLHNLSDLKEEKLNALLKKTGSVEVTFLGHRYEEKKGFIKLQLNKTDFDHVITTSMVELSNDRALSAEQMPEIMPGVQNPVLQKMTEEATGEELELASVFVNNIPSDTRPGIMKMLFPAARNIQFPTLKDGKSQGYAILEVSKKFADAFVKHHEVYRPVIGGKVLKLHVISNQGQKPDTDEVIEIDDEDDVVLIDIKTQESPLSDKGNVDTENPSASKAKPYIVKETKGNDQPQQKSAASVKRSNTNTQKSNIEPQKSSTSQRSTQVTQKGNKTTQKSHQAKQKGNNTPKSPQATQPTGQQAMPKSQQATKMGKPTPQSTTKIEQKSQHATKKSANIAQKTKEVINLDDDSPPPEKKVEKRLNPKTSTPVKHSHSPLGNKDSSKSNTFKPSERSGNRGRIENKNRFSKGESKTSRRESRSPGRSRWSNLSSEQSNRQSRWQQSNRSTTEQPRSSYRQQQSGPQGAHRRESDPGKLQPSRKGMLGDGPQMGRSLTGLDRPLGMMPAMEGQLMPQVGLMPGQAPVGEMMSAQTFVMEQGHMRTQNNMFTRQGMQIPGNAAGYGGSFPGQSNMMELGNMMSAQANMMGGQGNMMGGQGNMMGGQGNVMRGQGNVMVGQGNMMVGQGNMMSGLGNMVDIQGNMMGGQGNMMGGQGNMMGGQGNMMGRQGNMTGPGNMMDIQENMMDVKGSLQDVMMAQQGSLMSQRRNAGLQGGNVMSNQEVLMSQGQQLNPQQGSLLGQPGNVTTGQGGMAMKPQHGTGMISMGRGSEGGLLPHPGGLLTSQTGMTSDRPGQRSGLRPTGNRSSENSVQRIIEPGMRLSEYVGPGSKLLGSRSDRHDHRPSQIDSKGALDRNTSSKLRRSWSPKRRNRYSVDRNIEEKFDGFRTGRRSRFSDLGCDDVSQMKSERGSAYTRNPDFRSRSPNTRSQSPGYRSRSPQDFHSRSPRRGNDRNTGKLSDFSTNQSADWRNRNQVRCGRAKRLDRDESSGHDKPQERERRSRFDESSPDIQSRDHSPAVGQLGGRGRPTEGEDQMYTGRGGSFSTRSRQNMRLTEEEIPDLASIRNQLLDQLQQLETGNLSDTAALADIADKLKKVQQQQKLQQQQQQLQQQKQQQQLQLQGGRYKSDHVDPSYTQGQRFDASIGRSRKGEHRTLFDTETYEDSNIDRHQHFDHSLQEKLHSFSPEPERRQWFDRSETRPRKEREDFQPMAGLTQANMVTFDYGHQKVLGAEFSEMTTRSNRESRWAGLREDQDNTDHDIHVADRGFSGTDLSVMDSEAYGRIDDAYSAKATGLLGDFPGRERSTKRQGVSFSSMEEIRGSSGYTNTEPDRRRGLQGQSQGLIGHSPRLMGQTQGLMDQSLGLMGQSQSLMGHSSRMMHQSQGVISQPALSGKTGNPVPLMSLTPSSSAGGRRGKRGTPKVHTKKVSVANLPPSANWKQITSFFNIHMNNRGLADPGSIRNPVTGVLQSRVNSTAFLVFNSEEEAEKAVSHLNGITYDKHTLRLELAA